MDIKLDIQADYESAIEGYDPNNVEYDRFPTIAELGSSNSILYFQSEDGKYEYVQSLNNADVRTDDDIRLKCEMLFDAQEPLKDTGIKFTIPNNIKLGQIFYTSPYGIIKKNKTGVGATTLEMRSPRNSIIVEPNRSLAFSKSISEKVCDTDKYKYCYVGTPMEGYNFVMPTIEEYIQDDDIRDKKFIVVADSLPKLITALGDIVYKDYFIMIDEIDSYQSDSTFRPALEIALDYYFRFPSRNRCLVSATVQEFTNPLINKEPIIEIEYEEPIIRTINLFHTNNPHLIAKEKIEKCYDTGRKVVIAYNSLRFIRQIIANLREDCKLESSILCGANSKDRASVYAGEIEERRLPTKITFMTSTYFTGIDIEEEFCLVSISNVKKIYTLLSPAKYTQIAGRCREPNCILEEIIIYNTNQYDGRIQSPESYKTYLLKCAEDLVQFISQARQLFQKYYKKDNTKRSFLSVDFIKVVDDIVKRSEQYYFRNTKVSIIRKDAFTDNYKPAFFIIDSIYESLALWSEIYSSPRGLYSILNKQGHIVSIPSFIQREPTQEQLENEESVNREFLQSEDNEIEAVIQKLRETSITDMILGLMIRSSKRHTKLFLERFRKLYKYIPFERLVEDLKAVGNKKSFRGYNNGAILWALSDDHLFKIDMKTKFAMGQTYTKVQIAEKMNALYLLHFHRSLPENSHARILKEFIEARLTNSHTGSYKIESYNKNNYLGNPLRRISPDENIMEYIEFSN